MTDDKLYGKNTTIKSLFDLQEFLSKHFTTSIIEDELIIKNNTGVKCLFNPTFQIYCNLYRLKPNEKKHIRIKEIFFKIYLNEREISTSRASNLPLDLPLNLSFVNPISGKVIKKENLGKSSQIDIYIKYRENEGQSTSIVVI